MAATAALRLSSVPSDRLFLSARNRNGLITVPLLPSSPIRRPFSLCFQSLSPAYGGGFSGGSSPPPSGGGGSGGAGGADGDDSINRRRSGSGNPIALFWEGWRLRVAADPQFPFKVLMEELVGVTACVLGDMASRPNFGLNELDFVFSTLVVGSILNFALMYLLAPTSISTGVATSAFPSNMFQPGVFSFSSRLATVFTKGVTFAAVGFLAGLAGTAISNGLIALRKKIDPAFETPNKPPPTLLNAGTWALHLGISSNLRYQSLNGLEYVLDNVLPGPVFKTSVVALRCLNNVLGGMSFVVLARLTGSQKAGEEQKTGLNEKLISEINSNGIEAVIEASEAVVRSNENVGDAK